MAFGVLAAAGLALAPSAFAGVSVGISLPGLSVGVGPHHHAYVGIGGGYYAPSYYGYYAPAPVIYDDYYYSAPVYVGGYYYAPRHYYHGYHGGYYHGYHHGYQHHGGYDYGHYRYHP